MLYRLVLWLMVLGAAFGFEARAQSLQNNVIFFGPDKHIDIVGMRGESRGGVMSVIIHLSNASPEAQTGYYRINWLDDQGFPLSEDDEPWVPVHLHGQQRQMVRVFAPSTAASHYKIEFSTEKTYTW